MKNLIVEDPTTNPFSWFWILVYVVIIILILIVISVIKDENKNAKKVKLMNEKYVSDIKVHNRAFFDDLENQHIEYELDYVDTLLGTKKDTKGISSKQKQFKFTIYYQEFEEMDCLYVDATTLKIVKVVEDVDEDGD